MWASRCLSKRRAGQAPRSGLVGTIIVSGSELKTYSPRGRTTLVPWPNPILRCCIILPRACTDSPRGVARNQWQANRHCSRLLTACSAHAGYLYQGTSHGPCSFSRHNTNLAVRLESDPYPTVVAEQRHSHILCFHSRIAGILHDITLVLATFNLSPLDPPSQQECHCGRAHRDILFAIHPLVKHNKRW